MIDTIMNVLGVILVLANIYMVAALIAFCLHLERQMRLPR